jgi:hypothetical protein
MGRATTPLMVSLGEEALACIVDLQKRTWWWPTPMANLTGLQAIDVLGGPPPVRFIVLEAHRGPLRMQVGTPPGGGVATMTEVPLDDQVSGKRIGFLWNFVRKIQRFALGAPRRRRDGLDERD